MNFKFEEIAFTKRSGEVSMCYATKKKKIPFTVPKYSPNSTAGGTSELSLSLCDHLKRFTPKLCFHPVTPIYNSPCHTHILLRIEIRNAYSCTFHRHTVSGLLGVHVCRGLGCNQHLYYCLPWCEIHS